MTIPKWTKPGLYGALVGAAGACLIGFSWGDWTTGSTAREMAQKLAADEVTLAMVPVCLNMSAADPDRTVKLAALQEASAYNRRRALMETGWATPPGSDTPSRDLAEACIAGLKLDGS